MPVGAIVVLGGPALLSAGPAPSKTRPLDCLAGTPIAALEILGQSALQRTIKYLQQVGVKPISLAAAAGLPDLPDASICSTVNMLVHPTGKVWPVLSRVFDEYIKGGVETILLMRLGAYVEFDFADLLQFHREKAQPMTQLTDGNGPLDFWMIDALHFSAAGMHLLEKTFAGGSGSIAYYDQATYVNRLSLASDVRHLVVDAFSSRHAVRPSGTEIGPGVWLDDNARVHPRARVAGPAYIGRDTRVQATALLARFSSVERSCNIGCGTVVADASILAHTHLGAWLDVSHAVIYGSKVAHLRHNVTVDIKDDRLIRRRTSAFHQFLPSFPDVREP